MTEIFEKFKKNILQVTVENFEEEKLICRWDNAEHWKDIPTFPHHKHIGSIEKVESSTTANLEDVLTEIITIIKTKMK